ncbi:MAG: NnrU family protein [Candidatus Binatus sp.]|uniref:NnrU family protein n=1 Tax=Candidatus Binatus sp. TaxID=2811406 RepID=UPI0027244438|nr:NnrU family protein [Candidatus Binatus sp.]MDO8433985.1 NnrU family protein [Candidatus Binatus sp.]
MTASAWIALWAILFVLSHLVISSSRVRPRLVAAVGEQPYRGIYSLIAFGTLGPLIYEFSYHKHAGPMLWYFRDSASMRTLTWILMFIALILFAASLINPNPGGLGAPTTNVEPHGVLKITRHPGFVAFSLFGLAHLPMNGWAGDVIFFGMFPVISIAGGLHQDRRKLREIGDSYRQFVAKTSFIPFGALATGRQHWNRGDLPWVAIAIGLALGLAIVFLHPFIFGGNPAAY